MLRKLLYLLTIVWVMSSCASALNIINADANMRKVSVGMTEKEVVAIMGKQYEVVEANSEGTVWVYRTGDESVYRLYFEGGKLAEWEKQWPVKIVEPVRPHPHHHH